MITRFRVQNYKALRDVELALTPIHVLIGPNDSGKTSILEAAAALFRSADHRLADAFSGDWAGSDLVWQGRGDLAVALEATASEGEVAFNYRLVCRFGSTQKSVGVVEETFRDVSSGRGLILTDDGASESAVCRNGHRIGAAGSRTATDRVREALAGVHFYRWIPGFLALPAAPEARFRDRMATSGFGLPTCLDSILGSDRRRFDAIEQRFKAIFPQFESIKLVPGPAYRMRDEPAHTPFLQPADGKGLYFELAERGQIIPAAQVSDGVLLILAYLTLLNLPCAPRAILIEEPENGIHPKRLQEVLSILRDLLQGQTRTQVLMTTHSPYVVDLFDPQEVTHCMREPDGAVSVRRLSESKTVREQIDVFTLGEIWTAEGDEALTEKSDAAVGSTQ